jgi:hypothetical protein
MAAGLLPHPVSSVISGTARGVDQAGERWAIDNALGLDQFPADWSQGKGAGFKRNVEMAQEAEQAICFWDGKSRGTWHMLQLIKDKGIPLVLIKKG